MGLIGGDNGGRGLGVMRGMGDIEGVLCESGVWGV